MTRTAPRGFRLHLGNTHVDVVGRKLNDGGLLIQVLPLQLQTHWDLSDSQPQAGSV